MHSWPMGLRIVSCCSYVLRATHWWPMGVAQCVMLLVCREGMRWLPVVLCKVRGATCYVVTGSRAHHLLRKSVAILQFSQSAPSLPAFARPARACNHVGACAAGRDPGTGLDLSLLSVLHGRSLRLASSSSGGTGRHAKRSGSMMFWVDSWCLG